MVPRPTSPGRAIRIDRWASTRRAASAEAPCWNGFFRTISGGRGRIAGPRLRRTTCGTPSKGSLLRRSSSIGPVIRSGSGRSRAAQGDAVAPRREQLPGDGRRHLAAVHRQPPLRYQLPRSEQDDRGQELRFYRLDPPTVMPSAAVAGSCPFVSPAHHCRPSGERAGASPIQA